MVGSGGLTVTVAFHVLPICQKAELQRQRKLKRAFYLSYAVLLLGGVFSLLLV